MKFTFTIKGRLDSMNRTLKIPRWRFAQSRRRALVKYHVGSWVMAAQIPQFKGPVKIHVRWVERDKRRDRDNIRSSIKPILDALVIQERIVNDSQKWLVELTDSYDVDKENPRIEVTIEDAGPDKTTPLSSAPAGRGASDDRDVARP
jgi:Holliday junction resolvase RusA-like endonuclease